MISFFKHKISTGVSILLSLLLLTGCLNYFENPLKDKTSGEDINLLILDFNFFETRISVKLFDAETGEQITSESQIWFSGDNGNDIVTFAGKRIDKLLTTQGQVEVAVDPNVSISENAPFLFAVHVNAPGYIPISKGVKYVSNGKKSIEMMLITSSNDDPEDIKGDINVENGDTTFVFTAVNIAGLKSTSALNSQPAWQINYSISLQHLLKIKDNNGRLLFNSTEELMSAHNNDPDNFIAMSVNKNSGFQLGNDIIDIDGEPFAVMLQPLETGKLISLNVGGKSAADLNGGVIKSWCSYIDDPLPDMFGFAHFTNSRWYITGVETTYDYLFFNYTVIKASGEPLCLSGSTINFISDVISSFSIDADVYDMNDNFLTTINFKGKFPETFNAELVPSKEVKLKFRDNNSSFKPIEPLVITDFCSGDYNVLVEPANGFIEYQVVLKAFCPDDPTLALAPTYSGEYKIVGSNHPWQGIDMIGGVTDLLGLPGKEYQLRFLWDDRWEQSTLFTEFDKDGRYLHPNSSKIRSEIMNDGRIRIIMEHNFSQSVCDDLGW